MQFPATHLTGTLIKRYKRFLADIQLDDGSIVTAHTPNSGSMMGCAVPGSRAVLTRSNSPGRKYPLTWELVQVNGIWIGIHTSYPPKLVAEGVVNGTIAELQGYPVIRPEVTCGESRIDLLLSGGAVPCWVEVKNVTLVEDGVALFPDAVTTRGQKHLRELLRLVRQGERGVIFYVIQRGDAEAMAPADRIDPEYGRLLREVVSQGVEALAYRAEVSPTEIRLVKRLPVLL
ncbi:DNA/RNA nuclease SfsA [Geobacter pelophilus]|uniref:Sugar fermentation stimulation protein homolog n=1 Tax=Geoanaerobacter pelophilus TaxID=60036 RepID=A0AAW4L2T7_9BACT|nr:DNA/RNA nuclease SfsA [Geoanaerobacter pelophilus]MBT0665434.1 DNA/RNA nuclease SfsA [Geoanaerobacter pelophilus]